MAFQSLSALWSSWRQAGSTVLTPSEGSTYHLDRTKAKQQVGHIRRFRILVIGRANAGKTTILQRICNTMDQPEVFDGEGHRINSAVVQGSANRGYHNIEYELAFKSNPRFVFHDSCGFEAGSTAQFDQMKVFVTNRAHTTELNKRIHAIWYCIPLSESHRMITAGEAKFFEECDTGHVPVIVLLTKADTLELEAIQEVEELELGFDQASRMVAEVQQKLLNQCLGNVQLWLNGLKFPPHGYMPLIGMHQEGVDCTALLRCTASALNEESLQKLLISTQQSSLALCIEFSVMKTLSSYMVDMSVRYRRAMLSAALSEWFPYDHYSVRGSWQMLGVCQSYSLPHAWAWVIGSGG
ncbi:hypothetical protein EV401DRAFT_1954116 [Pisolithus croceorrhizus]|nr:hypothetical protein EV401DRAFT_1954116 [Pisolithus croceorrhizus]